MWVLKREALLDTEELEFIKSLDIGERERLNAREKNLVHDLYLRKIAPLERHKQYGCFELEIQVKWAGSRTSVSMAKAIMLNLLAEEQKGNKVMADSEAANFFHKSLSNRASCVQLMEILYERA